jgi:hypothetical protein
MTADVNVTNYIPDWEIKLKASLQQAGFNDQERQGKIIGDIANELQKKGTTKPIERDIFEAASEVYEFNNKKNLGLAKAIDELDGETNIQLSESNAKWQLVGANNKNSSSGSIPDWEIKLKASLQQAGFNDQERQGKIIGDIANELQKKGTTKPTKKDIFEAADEVYEFNNKTNLGLAKAIDGLDGEINIDLSESKVQWTGAGTGAVINKDEREQPNDSRNIIGRSIERIKTKNSTKEITVPDILLDLEEKGVIKRGGSHQGFKNKHLYDNLVAMRDQGVTAEEIIKATETETDTDWKKLIRRVKSPPPSQDNK